MAAPMHGSEADVLVVQRWKRWGHDRAYVRRDDEQLGYRDLRSGQVHCVDTVHDDAVTRATESLWREQQERVAAESYEPRHATPVSEAVAECPLSAVSPVVDVPIIDKPKRRSTHDQHQKRLLPDRDLAAQQAGSAARAQATDLRDAAPVRTFFQRVVGAKTDERAWRIGADAEEEVGRRLAKLGPEWRVLHAVPIGDHDSDIDHVVIGPAGVFTINTKHHPTANVWVHGDTVKVNGQNLPYIRNSRFEARRAAALLSARASFDVEVTGLVVVMGATGGFTIKSQPADEKVIVMTRREVGRFLGRRPAVLDTPLLERIYEVARHLATWQPKTVGWDESCLRG